MMAQDPQACYCISCAREFHPHSPDVLLCPDCGGPPEADASQPADPSKTRMDSYPSETLFEPSEAQIQNEAEEYDEWQPGEELLGTYTVVGLLGAGGMGKVYRVHHKSWNIDLAVKSPHKAFFKSREQKETFKTEAETWVNLGLHPHIVSCYYVRSIDNISRVFAELVEGGSLEEWIQQGRITTVAHVLDIAIQFAWGLAYAHEQGLVHRDVKPANVLVTRDGTVKVTDFGLAKGGIGMTPAYVSPEQAEAQLKAVELTPQSDMWSWGLSVLEMFAGQPFWVRADRPHYAWGQVAPQALEHYLSGELEDPAFPEMPADLAQLLRECFQKNPADRPASLNMVAERLVDIYAAETHQPYPRQKPKAAELRADSLNNKALSLVDIGQVDEAKKNWELALKNDPNNPTILFNFNLIKWRTGELTDLEILKKIKAIVTNPDKNWMISLFLVWIHIERGDEKSARTILKKDLNRESNRPEVMAASRQLDAIQAYSIQPIKKLQYKSWGITAICLNTDGTKAVTADQDRRITMWDLSTGKFIWVGHFKSSVETLKFSKQGKKIFSSGDEVRFWNEENGELVQQPLAYGGAAVLAPDESFYVVPNGIELVEYKLDGSLIQKYPILSDAIINSVDISSDGKCILSGGEDRILRVWDRGSREIVVELHGHNEDIWVVRFWRNGQQAVSGDYSGSILVWNVNEDRFLRHLKGHSDCIRCLEIDPNNRYAVSGSEDGTVRFWDLATGQCFRTQKYKESVQAVCVSEDGSLVLSAGDEPWLWRMDFERGRQLASMHISSISTAESAISLQSQVEQAILRARFGWITQFKWPEAVEEIRKARSIQGFERDPRLIELWSELYLHQPYQTLADVWEVLTLKYDSETLIEGACFESQDNDLIVYGDVNEIYSLPEGKQAFSFANTHELERFLGYSLHEDLPSDYQTNIYCRMPSPDQCYMAFVYQDGNAVIQETGTDSTFYQFNNVQIIHWNPDGKYVGILYRDGSADILEFMSRKTIQKFSKVDSLYWSPDGRTIRIRFEDKTAIIMDAISWETIHKFTGVQHIFWNNDGTKIIITGDGINSYDSETGALISTIHCEYEELGLIRRGEYLYTCADGFIKIWDLRNGSQICEFSGMDEFMPENTYRPEFSVEVSPAGKYILTRHHYDPGVTVYKIWFLDWELEAREKSEWTEEARPYLNIFLQNKCPTGGTNITDDSVKWREDDFDELLLTLACNGYGWLRPEGVRRKLEEMAKERR